MKHPPCVDRVLPTVAFPYLLYLNELELCDIFSFSQYFLIKHGDFTRLLRRGLLEFFEFDTEDCDVHQLIINMAMSQNPGTPKKGTLK